MISIKIGNFTILPPIAGDFVISVLIPILTHLF